VLVKFWLHVSKAEQLARFKQRQKDPARRYKITDDDWRNRDRWDAYRAAVHDMVTHTSTATAPWTLVESEDKLWARVRCLKTVVRAIEQRLEA
jgi:polyphosphate kinase 2 (PPK2 family)